MTRVLVTGGAGFLGSHLVDALLERGDEVTVLDTFVAGNKLSNNARTAARIISGDVKDVQTVAGAARGAQTIYHLAALVGVDHVSARPLETMETEAAGMAAVCAAASRVGAERIVHASSSSVHGEIEAGVTDALSRTPYARAMLAAEAALRAHCAATGITGASLRYFNLYGPRQDTRMVLPRFLAAARAMRTIQVFNDGAQTRDFTWIGDAVAATLAAGDGFFDAATTAPDIATGVETRIDALAQLVRNSAGSAVPIENVAPDPARALYEVRRRCGDAAPLRAVLGGEATTLAVGLGRLNALARLGLDHATD